MELLLLENEEVIQAFSPHTTQKTFANGIGLRGLIRGSKHLDATGYRYSCKMLPEFPIIIPNQVFGCLPIWRCLPQLLRDPRIGGGSCHIHVHDFPRFQLDDEKGKQRMEEEIGDLQEITGPHQGSHDCGERSSKSVHERILDGSASYTSEWSVYSGESPT